MENEESRRLVSGGVMLSAEAFAYISTANIGPSFGGNAVPNHEATALILRVPQQVLRGSIVRTRSAMATPRPSVSIHAAKHPSVHSVYGFLFSDFGFNNSSSAIVS